MKNYIIYQRVSTPEQAKEGVSLEAMFNSCRRYVKNQDDGRLIKVYEDAGISGSKINKRPALKELIKDIESGGLSINVVLVWNLDRLSRNRKDLDFLKEFFDKKRIELHSVSDGKIDTSTASGNLTFGIKGVVSQYYRDDIAEKTHNALFNKATNGEFNGGVPPFSYLLNEKNEYVIDEKKSKIIKYIYQRFPKIKSFCKLAKELNQKGNLSPKEKEWSDVQIKRILTHPVYKGAYCWDRNGKRKISEENLVIKENFHPAIISKELWNNVQKIIFSKNTVQTQKQEESYVNDVPLFSNGNGNKKLKYKI